MSAPSPWHEEKPVDAYFAAIDVVGFSEMVDDDLRRHIRYRLEAAIRRSGFAGPETRMQFLGDEYRLAAPFRSLDERSAVNGIVSIMNELAEPHIQSQPSAKVRAVLLRGEVRHFENQILQCEYLLGDAVARAREWADNTHHLTQHLAIDPCFKDFVSGLFTEEIETAQGGVLVFRKTQGSRR